MATNTVYDIVTDVILKRLEAGIIPWCKPWKTFGQPILPGCANFTSPYFLTFKLFMQHGGHIHKDEHPLPCTRMDSKLIVIAVAQAQKATDFILGKGRRTHE